MKPDGSFSGKEFGYVCCRWTKPAETVRSSGTRRSADICSGIGPISEAHLFGDILSRDNLDWRTRELSTVAALSVLDGVKNELNTHIAHAKHNGVTQAQIDEVLIMAARCRNGMVLSESDEPAKTFQTDPTITVRKVFYKNRYDIMLCAEMYLPKDFNEAQHYAALIIGHVRGCERTV